MQPLIKKFVPIAYSKRKLEFEVEENVIYKNIDYNRVSHVSNNLIALESDKHSNSIILQINPQSVDIIA